ncbi:MAG: NTP transferase domain-containing protein [Actinomycetes bacterium]
MTTPANKNPPVGVILLAAGGGSRFGGSNHKLLTEVAGKTVFGWALQSALDADIGPVAVVWGSVVLPRYEGSAAVTYLHNEAWATGMASSVQCALRWASERGLQSVVIGLGDQPCVPPSAWAAVARSISPLAVATYQGVRANPVKLHAEFFAHVPQTGDEGARSLLRSHSELVAEVPCIGSGIDVDHVEDIERVAHIIHESRGK